MSKNYRTVARRLLGALVCLFAARALAAEIASSVPMPVSFSQVLSASSVEPSAIHKYGSSLSQEVWVWLPVSDEATATIVLVHGGCWLKDYSVDHIAPLATALANAGYSVWAPEYRRVGEEGGGWPGTFEDVQLALATLSKQQQLLGLSSRVIFVGHSAGGHLALWMARRFTDREANPNLDAGDGGIDPIGVIGLAAITDLVSYAQGDNSCQRVTPELMGGGPQELLSRYQSVSPAFNPPNMPIVLLRGDSDGIVGVDQVEALKNAQKQELAGAGHFDWIHPNTAAFAVLLRRIEALINTSTRREFKVTGESVNGEIR